MAASPRTETAVSRVSPRSIWRSAANGARATMASFANAARSNGTNARVGASGSSRAMVSN